MSKEFIWADELVLDFALDCLERTGYSIDKFKASHQPKEDKPDWEIVQLRGKYGRNFIYNKKDGMWLNEFDCGWGVDGAEPRNTGCDIHAVRRNSDLEVFTVGEITDGGNKIIAFDVTENHLRVRMGTVATIEAGWFTNIQSLVKKQPQKEEQARYVKIDVDKPLNISMREIASCITMFVYKGRDASLSNETSVIDWRKLDDILKLKQ